MPKVYLDLVEIRKGPPYLIVVPLNQTWACSFSASLDCLVSSTYLAIIERIAFGVEA